MADEIQVRSGGDAAGIRTAADQAKGTVQSFAASARGQNATARQSYDELKAAIDAANASLRQIQASAENTSTLATQARAVAVLVSAYVGLRAAGKAISGATGRTYAAVGTAIAATATAARSGATPLVRYAFNALSVSRALDVTALSTQGLSALVERARAYGNEMRRSRQEQLNSYSALGPLAGLFASRLRGLVDEADRVTEVLEKQLEVIERRNASLARTPLDAGQLPTPPRASSATPRRPGSIRRPAGSTCCASASRARSATPPR